MDGAGVVHLAHARPSHPLGALRPACEDDASGVTWALARGPCEDGVVSAPPPRPSTPQSPTPQPPAPSPGRPSSARPNPTMADVVRVVVLLAVGIVTIGWLGSLFRADTVVEPAAVDYAAIAATAQDAAGFELVVPADLPDGWRATSARWHPDEQRWHLGLLTAEDQYVGLEQLPAGVSEARTAYAPDATEAGSVTVGGRTWMRLVDEDTGAVTLLREWRSSTVLVNGSAPEPALEGFARLVTASPPS